jgi:putative ABC transport system substrate-binding protein
VRRIGLLSPALDSSSPYVAALRAGLRDLGWIEGDSIHLDFRTGERDELPALAAELVTRGAELLVADTATAAHAVRAAPIPVVALVGDPARYGLAQSLARPGGNVTGIASLAQDLAAKRLELLRAIAPSAEIVVVLYRSPDSFPEQELAAAARSLGLAMEALRVDNSEALRAALQSAALQRAHAVSVWPDPLFFHHDALIIGRLAELRRPAIFGEREQVEAGGLMSYGPDVADAFRRLAVFVDRVLRSVAPGDIPFERMDKVQLVINLNTAKALGLAISPSLLPRADEAIE